MAVLSTSVLTFSPLAAYLVSETKLTMPTTVSSSRCGYAYTYAYTRQCDKWREPSSCTNRHASASHWHRGG
jgi:hypothetical protein